MTVTDFQKIIKTAFFFIPLLITTAIPGCTGNDMNPEKKQKMELGKKVFTELSEPACSSCHAFSDANSTGSIGPDLDKLKPEYDRIITAVKNGVGVMPSQKEILTDEEMEAVAFYITETLKKDR